MATKKRHWLWNILIVVTLVVCILAFVAHAKNWTRVKDNNFQILSGVYHKKIPLSDIDSVQMVDKIPSMERINGFSAMTTEKGVFKDSIRNTKVYVYVDNLEHQKIRLVYEDSLELFINYSDSTETQELYQFFKMQIDSLSQ